MRVDCHHSPELAGSSAESGGDMESKAAWKTCEASQLEALTTGGWQLREIVSSTQQEPGLHVTKQVPNQYGGASYVTEATPPVLVTKPIFVLARSRDAELQDLRARLDRAENDVANASHQADLARAESRRLEALAISSAAAIDDLKKQLVAALAATDDARAATREVSAEKRALQQEMAAIRKELGEARWREVTSAGGA